MSAQGGHPGRLHSRRAPADDHDLLLPLRRLDGELSLGARPRVDKARLRLPFEDGVETTLVARDAGVDLVEAPRPGLIGKLRVGDQAAGEADEVRFPVPEDPIGEDGIVNPVAGHDRHGYGLLDPPGEVSEAAPGQTHGELGHPGLVPAAGDVDHVHPGFLKLLGEYLRFPVGQPPFHELISGQAKDERKFGADFPADFPGHLNAEAHSVFELPPVFILPPVYNGR